MCQREKNKLYIFIISWKLLEICEGESRAVLLFSKKEAFLIFLCLLEHMKAHESVIIKEHTYLLTEVGVTRTFLKLLQLFILRIDDISYNCLFVSYGVLISCGLFQNLNIIISCFRLSEIFCPFFSLLNDFNAITVRDSATSFLSYTIKGCALI